MPELPELEIVREVLEDTLQGARISSVNLSAKGGPIVVRDLQGAGFAETLAGRQFTAVQRRGKFLLFELEPEGWWLAINPKLSGRLQLAMPGEKKAGPVHATFEFEDMEQELRYVDRKRMGQLYLTQDLDLIPNFRELGPEPLEISLEEFKQRLKKFRGEIKGVLTRGQFVAGIGNAYADEILWHARLHPYRKRPSLAEDDIVRLYEAMRSTLLEAIATVREKMGHDIHTKPRDFFSVHLRGGQACPRCGGTISAITANQRETNFCRSCQPGGLFKGMEC